MPAHKKRYQRASKGTDLGQLCPAWKGWQLVGEKLVGPVPGTRLSAKVSAHDIGAIPLMLAKIEAQREEIKALRRELEGFRDLEEQPAPTTWSHS